MLDRERAAWSPRWMRAYAPLIAAAFAIVIGGWLTYAGIDYARNGCECDEPWYPDWIWAPIIGLAAMFYAVALGLGLRWLASRSRRGA